MSSGEPVITVGKKRVTPVCEYRANGTRDLFVAGRRRVVIDAGEAVHLQIDPAGRNDSSNRPSGESSGSTLSMESREARSRFFSGCEIDAVTFHRCTGLCTSFPQARSAKCKTERAEESC